MKGIILAILLVVSELGFAKVGKSTTPIWIDFVKPNSIVISKSERRLYLVHSDKELTRYPIAVGKRKTPSPPGEYTIASKVRFPTWYPPNDIRFENPNHILPKRVPPGPRNPLGPRAIYLSRNMLRIHGTNKPGSVGRAVSHGCFRMYNKDVIALYDKVSIGMPVYVFK